MRVPSGIWRAALLLAAVLGVAGGCRGCGSGGDKGEETGGSSIDTAETAGCSADDDGDGYGACDDCDDMNASVNAGVEEDCDGVDNDCDGDIDEDVINTYYADEDGDGFGDDDITTEDCALTDGWSRWNGDCNDGDASIYPDAEEICDGVDNDCDGETDDDTGSVYYLDSDGDGYGDAGSSTIACSLPAGYAETADDCDDDSPSIHPGAEESDCADPVDYNCDGSVGERDADGDGWLACEECRDDDASVHPSAPEVCDDLDDDCDGLVDDEDPDLDLSSATAAYPDGDGDGYGDDDAVRYTCEALPEGHVALGADCDDSDAGVNPGAIEYCDALDNDCDGLADEGEPVAVATYPDLDGDGHGDPAGESMACPSPEGYVRGGDDCDDADPEAHPGAEETDCADPKDYNCDGSTGFEDTDADGWFACEDCDDGDATVGPCDEP